MDVLPIAQEVEESNHGIYYAERFIIGYRSRRRRNVVTQSIDQPTLFATEIAIQCNSAQNNGCKQNFGVLSLAVADIQYRTPIVTVE